jgi:hypothetical protein
MLVLGYEVALDVLFLSQYLYQDPNFQVINCSVILFRNGYPSMNSALFPDFFCPRASDCCWNVRPSRLDLGFKGLDVWGRVEAVKGWLDVGGEGWCRRKPEVLVGRGACSMLKEEAAISHEALNLSCGGRA